jgi:hypothetical protein
MTISKRLSALLEELVYRTVRVLAPVVNDNLLAMSVDEPVGRERIPQLLRVSGVPDASRKDRRASASNVTVWVILRYPMPEALK